MNGSGGSPESLRVDDVAVIGAGAAGLMTALFAARSGPRVLLLESSSRPGAKIRISGGGRCNVLPNTMTLEDFQSEGSAAAMRNVLFSWELERVRAFFEEDLGVPLVCESNGKLFPRSGRSKDVVEAFLSAIHRAGVDLRADSRVTELLPGQRSSRTDFRIRLANGRTLEVPKVVLATGGRSLPKTGSDGAGYGLARQLGHTIRPTRPALVPLLAEDPGWGTLSGVSLPVTLTAIREGEVLDQRTGDFLFTHSGFSGPVVLDISSWVTGEAALPKTRVLAHFGGSGVPWEAILSAGGPGTVVQRLREFLPRRLADRIPSLAGVPGETRASALPRRERAKLVEHLTRCDLGIRGHEGYAKAEVTAGGVPLEEVHLSTLESRLVPGLYFAGEILDVTGRIGGFNFHWAWVTGRKAGLAIGEATR